VIERDAQPQFRPLQGIRDGARISRAWASFM
jgi:hypothetical protein